MGEEASEEEEEGSVPVIWQKCDIGFEGNQEDIWSVPTLQWKWQQEQFSTSLSEGSEEESMLRFFSRRKGKGRQEQKGGQAQRFGTKK